MGEMVLAQRCVEEVAVRGGLLLHYTELEALGDDLLTEDDDATFLDAAEAPEPPTKIPGGTETVSGKVRYK